jgi:hypothetical protein
MSMSCANLASFLVVSRVFHQSRCSNWPIWSIRSRSSSSSSGVVVGIVVVVVLLLLVVVNVSMLQNVISMVTFFECHVFHVIQNFNLDKMSCH